jgi:hypothetical protein
MAQDDGVPRLPDNVPGRIHPVTRAGQEKVALLQPTTLSFAVPG